AIDLKKKVIFRYAGSGKERRIDGPPASAAFAQPSGLATDGKSLFVLDSETSSVRAIDLSTAQTKTIVGEDLFIFGDVDGDAKTTRLQHPIGIAYASGSLFIADSYNSKIKRIDPTSGESKTIGGGKGRLSEPAGLTLLSDGSIVVADTNASRLVRMSREGSIQPMATSGLAAPSTGVSLAAGDSDVDEQAPRLAFTWKIPAQRSSAVKLVWRLPEGTAINDDAPVKVRWTKTEGPVEAPVDVRLSGKDAPREVALSLSTKNSGDARLEGVLSLVVCDAVTHRVCVPVKRALKASVMVADGGTVTDAVIELPAAK
ncbi:MAG: hypothetical protein U0165_16775, partial [Polyangiaceae bacterium]